LAKNIVIFSDGTAQAGGRRPEQRLSNIYKLYCAARTGSDSAVDPAEQISIYEAGLGTTEIAGSPLLSPFRYARKVLGLGLGTGFMHNVADCYEAILKYHEPGDRVFLIGFSRGAYTVRTVCSVMNLCGIPSQGPGGTDFPRDGKALRKIVDRAVLEVYWHGAGRKRRKYEPEREELARRFREDYGSQDDAVENKRGNVAPYFVGVFDTVASLGASGSRRAAILAAGFVILVASSVAAASLVDVLFPTEFRGSFFIVMAILALGTLGTVVHSQYRSIRDFPERGDYSWHLAAWHFRNYDMYLDPRVGFARHAVSIDEERADFARVGWARASDVRAAKADWLIQKWFAGNHSDIGGGYPAPESRLSDIALTWMVEQATMLPHPLKVDGSRLKLFPDAGGRQHCEVRRVKEKYPDWVPSWLRFTWRRKSRDMVTFENCHETVLERMKCDFVYRNGERITYRPAPLKDEPELEAWYRDTDASSRT
jgi:uncharacterized protein (DUF2235 family)